MAFTPAQQSAMNALNSELLVSAAAGSGKTAVLVERIYTLIQQRGYQIDRMLVVTFTNAAAAEMRERLEARFLEKDGHNDVLRRQAELVENAQISTLHAFCQKLVREFFEIAAIDPLSTLCDEMMKKQLLTRALEETLALLYEQALNDENLGALTRKFTQREIEDMLLSLYSFLLSLPHPFAWLHTHTERQYSEEDLSHGPMAETLLADCRILIAGARAAWARATALVQTPHCKEGYSSMLREDGLVLDRLHEASYNLLALLKTSVESTFGKMPGYRLKEPAEIHLRDQLKMVREQYKKRVDEMQALLPRDASQGIRDLEAMQPALRGLAQAAKWLHNRYGELKSDRNVIDFSDLEHMALSILGQPRIQAKVSRRFDAIFVDEYQDISEIQEAILNAVKPFQGTAPSSLETEGAPAGSGRTRPVNEGPADLPLAFSCFYVGDVKQSIYRFRQADPSLFIAKQRQFSADAKAEQRKISLSHNFRSRESVLHTVNRVFSHVMQESVTEIDYDADAMLYPGLPSAGDVPPQLHLMMRQGKKAADQFREEAKKIAAEINRLVGQPLLDRAGNESGVLRYRDMVILLPIVRGVVVGVEQALTSAGIPVYCEDQKSGMESPEIRQALVHLRLLDNMMDDLSFLAALRGPQYTFSEEELAQVRLHKTELNASYLEAFMAAADAKPKSALSSRCQKVLLDFKQERFLQQSMPLDEYLWDFLRRSGMYDFYGAQPGGKLRQANLRMLCTQASEHVTRHGGDLHFFLQTIGDQETLKEGSSPVLLSPWEDVVRIMTIHKSKGLEFPVVFVMGLGREFSRRGGAGILSAHSKLGVAIRYVNEE
ncbi:MAG: UvrD-helicase domain-containing protein, partial [Clostridia bacterium]|nr:UvrD-helicase domain-containing protein [Clostridia bacterium]